MTEIYQKNSFDSTNSTEDSAEQLFYVEELSEQLIRKFNAQILEPYFKNVYQDLLLRSARGNWQRHPAPPSASQSFTKRQKKQRVSCHIAVVGVRAGQR